MRYLKLLNIVLVILLLLLLRKLCWCVRWLWCYYRGREAPEPISFLPHRTGDRFDRHICDREQDDQE